MSGFSCFQLRSHRNIWWFSLPGLPLWQRYHAKNHSTCPQKFMWSTSNIMKPFSGCQNFSVRSNQGGNMSLLKTFTASTMPPLKLHYLLPISPSAITNSLHITNKTIGRLTAKQLVPPTKMPVKKTHRTWRYYPAILLSLTCINSAVEMHFVYLISCTHVFSISW